MDAFGEISCRNDVADAARMFSIAGEVKSRPRLLPHVRGKDHLISQLVKILEDKVNLTLMVP